MQKGFRTAGAEWFAYQWLTSETCANDAQLTKLMAGNPVRSHGVCKLLFLRRLVLTARVVALCPLGAQGRWVRGETRKVHLSIQHVPGGSEAGVLGAHSCHRWVRRQLSYAGDRVGFGEDPLWGGAQPPLKVRCPEPPSSRVIGVRG